MFKHYKQTTNKVSVPTMCHITVGRWKGGKRESIVSDISQG